MALNAPKAAEAAFAATCTAAQEILGQNVSKLSENGASGEARTCVTHMGTAARRLNVAMRASKLLRGLTNGATQEEDFKWANGHLYICNCTIEICTLSELHILVSSRSKPFETAKQLPKVEMNFSATKGRERKMPSHAKRETQRCPRCT